MEPNTTCGRNATKGLLNCTAIQQKASVPEDKHHLQRQGRHRNASRGVCGEQPRVLLQEPGRSLHPVMFLSPWARPQSCGPGPAWPCPCPARRQPPPLQKAIGSVAGACEHRGRRSGRAVVGSFTESSILSVEAMPEHCNSRSKQAQQALVHSGQQSQTQARANSGPLFKGTHSGGAGRWGCSTRCPPSGTCTSARCSCPGSAGQSLEGQRGVQQGRA